MRVLLCIYELLGSVGGAERSLSDLASALSKRGHAVLILNHQDVNKSGTALFYPLDKGVGLHSFTNESQRPDRPKDSSVESEGFIRYIRRRVFQCPLGHAGPWPPDVLQTKQVWLRDNELEGSGLQHAPGRGACRTNRRVRRCSAAGGWACAGPRCSGTRSG